MHQELDTSTAVEFLGRWTATANTADWPAFSKMLAADVTIADPLSPEPASGRDAALARARAQYEPFDDGVVEPVGQPFVGGSGNEIAYRWRFTGRHVQPIDPPGFAATGARVSIGGVSVLRLADDWSVRHVQLYFDSTEVARQIGAAPRPGSVAEHVAVAMQRVAVRVRRLKRRSADATRRGGRSLTQPPACGPHSGPG